MATLGDAEPVADVVHPQPAPLATLSRRIEASFDPADILNRGRLGLGP